MRSLEEERQKNKIKINTKVGLTTNLPCEFWANQLNYTIIGNMVFCNLVINTKSFTSTSSEGAYVEVPFTFDTNWLAVAVKASPARDYYLKCKPGTNKIELIKIGGNYDTPVPISEVSSGYVIYAEFFAFLK